MAVGTDTAGTDLTTSPTGDAAGAKRWWILAVLAIAQVMVVLDSTIVNIALPTAQHDLAFSDNDRQWIVTGYALAFGSLLLIGGRIADYFGRKRALLIGLVGFAVASAVGGAAVDFGMLVAARAVQGAFGALLAPAVLALLTTTFSEPKERAKAFGIFGGIAGAGASVGLLLGGFLTEYANWRWTLFVNLILAAVAFVGVTSLLEGQASHKNRTEPDGGRSLIARLGAIPAASVRGVRRFGVALGDIPGALTITVGLFAMVFGFSSAYQQSWSAPLTLGCFVLAGLLLVTFVVVETRVANPILPMRVVVDRNRGGAYLAMFMAGIGIFAVFLFLTYYLQGTLGYSAVKSGVAFLPMTGMIITVAGLGSAVLNLRVSARIMIPIGMTLAAVGLFLLTHIDVGGNYTSVVLPATLIMGAGLGLVFAPGFNLAVLGVDAQDAGVASASVNVMQQVGGSVGTSLFNTIALSAATSYAASHLAALGSQPSAQARALVAANSAIHSYTTAFWIAAGVFLAGAVISALVLRSGIAQPAEGDVPLAV